MVNAIEVNGKLEARGRNGWFKVARAMAWVFSYDNTAHVELQSKRMGDTAPIIFFGDKAEVISMLQGVIKTLEAAQ
jgi:hypothetical protein